MPTERYAFRITDSLSVIGNIDLHDNSSYYAMTFQAKREWELEPTINGYCLSLDQTKNRGQIESGNRPRLAFSITQNNNDSTDGWNSEVEGFTVSYGQATKN
mgnify:CR=1 FL=1